MIPTRRTSSHKRRRVSRILTFSFWPAVRYSGVIPPPQCSVVLRNAPQCSAMRGITTLRVTCLFSVPSWPTSLHLALRLLNRFSNSMDACRVRRSAPRRFSKRMQRAEQRALVRFALSELAKCHSLQRSRRCRR